MASRGVPADEKRAHRNVVMTAAIAGLGGLLFGYDTLWFCWKLVPETEDKQLEQIEAIFKERAGERVELPSKA